MLVRLREGGGDLVDQVARLGRRQWPGVSDVVFQVLPGDVLHHEVVQHRRLGIGADDLAGVDGATILGCCSWAMPPASRVKKRAERIGRVLLEATWPGP